MKRHWMKALALLLALTLTVITIALAEENVATGDVDDELIEVVESTETEPAAEEVEELALDDLMDLPAEEEPAAGETSTDTEWNGVQTWWFIAGDEAVAVLEAREGDEIQLPDDPAAPEGMAFGGWYFEDETPLLADADGDGAIDAVIAHPDPLVPEVNVLARFVEAEEPAEDASAQEPSIEEEASEATPKPSPDGGPEALASASGGAIAPEEAPSPAEDAPAPAAPALPTANALTYTGEAQALVTGEGWLYSLDGEAYSAELPAAVNAGEYTVYFIPADAIDAQPQALTVTVAKADVVFTPPVAAATGE